MDRTFVVIIVVVVALLVVGEVARHHRHNHPDFEGVVESVEVGDGRQSVCYGMFGSSVKELAETTFVFSDGSCIEGWTEYSTLPPIPPGRRVSFWNIEIRGVRYYEVKVRG